MSSSACQNKAVPWVVDGASRSELAGAFCAATAPGSLPQSCCKHQGIMVQLLWTALASNGSNPAHLDHRLDHVVHRQQRLGTGLQGRPWESSTTHYQMAHDTSNTRTQRCTALPPDSVRQPGRQARKHEFTSAGALGTCAETHTLTAWAEMLQTLAWYSKSSASAVSWSMGGRLRRKEACDIVRRGGRHSGRSEARWDGNTYPSLPQLRGTSLSMPTAYLLGDIGVGLVPGGHAGDLQPCRKMLNRVTAVSKLPFCTA